MFGSDGKYHNEATFTRVLTGAKIILLGVIGGNKGAGFEIQSIHSGLPLMRQVPSVLRQMADQIEADLDKIP